MEPIALAILQLNRQGGGESGQWLERLIGEGALQEPGPLRLLGKIRCDSYSSHFRSFIHLKERKAAFRRLRQESEARLVRS